MTTAGLATTRQLLLLRLAVLPSLAMGVVCASVGAAVAGLAGVFGAIIGAALVTSFFWFGQVVLQLVRAFDPGFFFLIGVLTYLLQVVVLLATFAAFRRHPEWSDHVSASALGLSIIACTAVWSVGLVVAATRERIPLYDLGGHR